MLPKVRFGSLRANLSRSRVDSSNAATSSAELRQGNQESAAKVIADMFLFNKLSGPDCARLARGALNSRAVGVERLAAVGGSGAHPRNFARDFMRQLLKDVLAPELFWYPVRVWDPVGQKPCIVQMPFLLPHRMLSAMGTSLQSKLLQPQMSPELRRIFQTTCGKLNLDPASTICLGLHGDGVPFSKKDSIELLSYNFLGDPMGDRVPFTGVSKMYTCKCGCLGKHTFDDILEVLVWSLRALVVRCNPSVGPKGEVLLTSLQGLAGQPLLCPAAILCQVRGDWPFLKTLFSIPTWANHAICWQCYADKDEKTYKDGSINAGWRSARKQWHEFFDELREKGLSPSPLFSAPGFELRMLVLDWLHIVDLGIAQDLIGSLFAELIRGGLDGANKAERLKVLWVKLLEFYKSAKVSCKLDNLTQEMFQRDGKSPKLKVKGGETRQLIPFAALISREIADKSGSQYWVTIAEVMDRLLSCCKHISAQPFVPAALAQCSRELCVLWSCLEERAESAGSLLWRKKPKVHLFQELCEYQVNSFGTPELFWTYRDESWCGHMSSAAKRRGGQKHASTVPERLLNRFRAMQKDGQECKL